jgi:hypothetical protein
MRRGKPVAPSFPSVTFGVRSTFTASRRQKLPTQQTSLFTRADCRTSHHHHTTTNTQRAFDMAYPYVCKLQCGRTFYSERALKSHQQYASYHLATYDCEYCDRTFTTEAALEQHERDSPAHQPATYDCEYCNRTFYSKHALEQHERDSPAHQPITYECEYCDRTFLSEQALDQHDRDAHPDEYDCETCGRTFYSETALEQHERDAPAHHPDKYDCNYCNRSFTSEMALQQHERDSPAHQPTFECDYCDLSFFTESALQQHERDSPGHHTFDCDYCDRSFFTESALRQHERDSPAHQITFECKSCDRIFSDEEALRQHERDSPAHQPQLPRDSTAHGTTNVNALYQQLCDSIARNTTTVQVPPPPQYQRKSKLERADPPASPLPFNCGRCDRSFSDKDALHKHERNLLAHIAIPDLEDIEQSLFREQDSLDHKATDNREASSNGDSYEHYFPASLSTGQRRSNPRSLRLFQRGVFKLQVAKQKIRHQHTASSWCIVVRD